MNEREVEMMLGIMILSGVYSYFYIRRIMKFFDLYSKGYVFKILNILLALFIGFSCRSRWSLGIVIILHVLVISVLLDAVVLIVRLAFPDWRKRKFYIVCKNIYRCGIVPIAITAVLFTYGILNMNYAVKTEYHVETGKNIEAYKIVLITDIHYGTIQNTDILKNKIDEINAQNPDIALLGGDIVEEGTSKEEMEEAFQVLGRIQARYGVYYVYGNHDRQPYTRNKSYTDEELANAIQSNGITILEDSFAEINHDLILAGRGDAAWGNTSGRATVEEILQGVDRAKYIIVADHQPIEAEENDMQGVDMELSGHTHAGQIWPVGLLSEMIGILNYGEYQIGNCDVIVSSGFTGWGYPVRTEEHCEYVVINVDGNAAD